MYIINYKIQPTLLVYEIENDDFGSLPDLALSHREL